MTSGRTSSALTSDASSRPRGVWRPVERLLARAIARRQQRPRAPVPQRQREHPAQAREEVHAPLLVGVDQDFDVGAAPERVAERLQLVAQRWEVVDLAVGDELNRRRSRC